jgi:hypothetical protein
MYRAKTHEGSEPHLSAIETWKAVATGAYWWPTWGHDVCNYPRSCKICRETEVWGKHPEENQNPTTPEPDWRHSIAQRLASIGNLIYIGTQDVIGLLTLDTETYFITEDGLKYRLPNGEVKMCVTREDVIDWVKRIHEYQVPHLTKEEAFTQVHKGPYWWPTISLDVERLVDECKICQCKAMLCLQNTKYRTIPSKSNETYDWREPIIQHLKHPMELGKLDFQEELGVLKDELPNYHLEKDILNWRLTNGDIKLCISRGEGMEWLTTIHNQRTPHLSMDEMIVHVTSGPYWWPTIPPDIDHLCRECMHCWPKESTEHVIDGTTITSKIKERHDHPRKGTPCNQCHHEAIKISQKKAKKGDTLKEEITPTTKKIKPSPRSKDFEPLSPQKVRFLPGQRVLWHLRHKIPGPSKFKIRWAGPYMIKQVYDNGSVDVTTLQGDSLGRVNMNKLKPYQEPETTQAYALQILVCHILEADIKAKQNYSHKENEHTCVPTITSSQAKEETISQTASTPYQEQGILEAEDLEVHRIMLEGYYIQPSTYESDIINHPIEEGDNPPQEDNVPIVSHERTLTLVAPKQVMRENFKLRTISTNTPYTTLLPLAHYRVERPPG